MIKTKAMPKYSAKQQLLWAVAATTAAVALPQICHLLSGHFGLGSQLGEMLLPMHLPVILIGLLIGPQAGFGAGLAGPLISFLLTGMPKAALLPFMMIELAAYGLCAGLLRRVSMPTVCRVLLTQIVGRGVRAAAIVVAVYGFGYTALSPSIIWLSIAAGAVGIALQLLLIPLFCRIVEKRAQ